MQFSITQYGTRALAKKKKKNYCVAIVIIGFLCMIPPTPYVFVSYQPYHDLYQSYHDLCHDPDCYCTT